MLFQDEFDNLRSKIMSLVSSIVDDAGDNELRNKVRLYYVEHSLRQLEELFVRAQNPGIKIIKVFIACSLAMEHEEKKAIETYLSRKNDLLVKKGIYLLFNDWKKESVKHNDVLSQAEINENLVAESEIFICIISAKAGQYTIEEYHVAREGFLRKDRKPYVMYVYCKDPGTFGPSVVENEEWITRIEFINSIRKDLKQIIRAYEKVQDLLLLIDRHIDRDIPIVLHKMN